MTKTLWFTAVVFVIYQAHYLGSYCRGLRRLFHLDEPKDRKIQCASLISSHWLQKNTIYLSANVLYKFKQKDEA
ncbi:hypothetical protein EYC80_005123 [Monilinia laxa]|uniref:Uncharacterized protein n=1 Tax=Monilinia laxa TaxID=61186 RepID=A0A5N6KIY1_MONLA|nr:hypothetical protein EYC80_005123 [Monilinia laxa]